MGGMQVLEWASSYPERVFCGAADRHRRAPFLAEHRLPRGRPAGGDGRSGLARRQIWRGRQAPGKGPGRGPHGRAHHLSLGGGAAPQVRPQPAGPRGADLRFRRRLPDRELSAPSGHDLRRPLRRQLLSLHDAGDGLFRPRRRPWRPARRRFCRHQDALLRGLLHQRLAVPDRGEPSRSCMR